MNGEGDLAEEPENPSEQGSKVEERDKDIKELSQDSIVADSDLKEQIRSIKEYHFDNMVYKEDINAVPSELAYKAILKGRKYDLKPSKVLKAFINQGTDIQEALEECSKRKMNPQQVAGVFNKEEDPYGVVEMAEKTDFNPVKVMEIKGEYPEDWKRILDISSGERWAKPDPKEVGMVLEKMPSVLDEAVEEAKDRRLDVFSIAMCLKFHAKYSENLMNIAEKRNLNLVSTSLTMERFDKSTFNRALDRAEVEELDVYWVAKCLENYPNNVLDDVFEKAKSQDVNPYIMARFMIGSKGKEKDSYEVNI